MVKHFSWRYTASWINGETLFDEVLSISSYLNVLREGESTRTNLLVGLLYLGGLKGRPAVEHSVQNDSDGPVVNFVTVATFGLKNFRSQVVRCTTNCAFTLSLVENLGGETEISNFKAHALGKEQVAEFEISVNYFS